MAASLKDLDPKTRVAFFYLDTDTQADVDRLPDLFSPGKENLSTVNGCAMGSVAFVINEDTYYYQLNGQNEWIKKKRFSGGGGGGDVDPEDYEWATEQDIDKMFP